MAQRYVDHVGVAQQLIAPHVFEQLAPTDDALRMAQEVREQLEGAVPQLDGAAAARDLVGVLVELDVGKGQDAAARLGGVSGGGDRAAAYERANAGDELLGRKRLAHVV